MSSCTRLGRYCTILLKDTGLLAWAIGSVAWLLALAIVSVFGTSVQGLCRHRSWGVMHPTPPFLNFNVFNVPPPAATIVLTSHLQICGAATDGKQGGGRGGVVKTAV